MLVETVICIMGQGGQFREIGCADMHNVHAHPINMPMGIISNQKTEHGNKHREGLSILLLSLLTLITVLMSSTIIGCNYPLCLPGIKETSFLCALRVIYWVTHQFFKCYHFKIIIKIILKQ